MYMEPLYYKVKKDMEQKILNGYYKRGEFIPSEPELGQYYKVSRTTVRKAINMLVEEGYVTIVRGMGTKVAPSKLKHKAAELMSFTELMKRQGLEPAVRDVQIKRIHPDQEVISALELNSWEEVFEISRVRTADNEPITINTSYIPCRLVEDRDLWILKDKQSLYQVLEDFNVVVQYTEDTVSAVKANTKQAEILQINKNDPLLYIERTAYDKNNIIVEFSRIVIRADRYKHIITLRRR